MIEKNINEIKKKYKDSSNNNTIIVEPWFWNVPTRPAVEWPINMVELE